MGILELLGLRGAQAPDSGSSAETAAVRKIAASLERLDPDHARYVAAFAYVLGRVAHADLDITDDESLEMERIVRANGGLSEEQAVLVVQMAKTQALLCGGTENFLVTREFNEIADRDQKLALLECLFAVSSADGGVSTVEANVIRQIADELKLDHRDYVAVRSRYRDRLDVLRRDGDDAP